MEYKNCRGLCVKKGCQNRRQKYYCKNCKLYQQKTYSYKLCTEKDEEAIAKLNNIGVGISGIARFTGISKANVVVKIRKLASKLKKSEVSEMQQEYEVDEMHTFVTAKSNSCYVTYAINRRSKQVIDFVVGSRTKENIGKVIGSLLTLSPKRIFTDAISIY